jgi:predicted  nucleic acid-binding Zn-ribbon protein
MEQHKCVNKEIIEILRERIRHLETESEIHKNNISSVKEDIKDMKVNLKDISEKMNAGFKAVDNKNIKVLTTEVVLLIGVIIDIAINILQK